MLRPARPIIWMRTGLGKYRMLAMQYRHLHIRYGDPSLKHGRRKQHLLFPFPILIQDLISVRAL